jgi:alpha-beta hydrolase superfamily lysophospholipase
VTTARWVPAAVSRGAVVVLTGRGESPEVYGRLGLRLSADGYLVIAFDWPVDGEDAAVQAVQQLALSDGDVAAVRSAGSPVVVIGSDDGAALALRSAAAFDAVVLAGIASPTASLGWVEELEARTACPVHRGLLERTGTFRRGALSDLPRVTLPDDVTSRPILMLHGESDVVTPLDEARKAVTYAASVQLALVSGGRHDVLNDVNHRSVAARIVVFLESLRAGKPTLVEILP